ncbi:MAG: PQQ-dependent sugar dehydrogenase [Proteobacteria bacterium]|nr:PQQ-dependent sugar dehydrogenase [Pseudomonadota bacterium]
MVLVLLALLAACGGSNDTSGLAPPDADNNDDSPYFPPPQVSGEPQVSEALDFHVETVASGLNIPWSIAFLPDGHVLVTERGGWLRLIENGELRLENITGVPDVFAQGQGGLLDVAVHPDYEDNGWIYLSYAEPGEGGAHTALMRARLDTETLTLVDQEPLFSGEPKTTDTRHFGGRIVLQEGYVYLSMGDRGVMDEAQNLGTHNGSIVRLHDDGRIPEDNPFVNQADALPETWSYGHRNTQGLAIHPADGTIWNNEHGPRGGDEINIIRRAGNYGWPVITYGVDYDGTPISDETEKEGMEQPLTWWTPSIAPSGLAFVTGNRYPGWQQNLMTGALAGQQLRRIVLDGEEVVHEEILLLGIGRIRDVRMGPDGYLYFANESDGTIRRIVSASQ